MKWSLTVKILFLPFLFLVGFLLLGGLTGVLGSRVLNEVVYPRFESQQIQLIKDTLQAVTDAQVSELIEKTKGVASRDEKIAIIIAETDPVRFFEDKSGYFFTADNDGMRINVPVNKALKPQNTLNEVDKKGNRYVQEFVKAAKAGGGFVEYYFEKVGKGIQPKLSYVKPIPGTDLYIGTGVYIDNVEEQKAALQGMVKSDVKSYTWIAIIVFLVFIAAVLLVSVFIARSLTRQIKQIAEGLEAGAEQVATASAHVSAASQELAEGASEQAASIEETSSSLEELSSMTKQNASNAAEANRIMTEAHRVVGRANQSMHHLTDSMREISSASEDTQKIIKTIDEIAFQTNLLALNAAVEAARAGEAGAGFAVVADEVRNLAMRAADAARNTAGLIEGTVKRVKDGVTLVDQTGNEFEEVASAVNRSKELAGEIASASSEQAQGIEQVNKAVSEMDQVTQRNAASAEESASASEEMSAQAEQMKGYVGDLVVLVGGGGGKRGADEDVSPRASHTIHKVSTGASRKAASGSIPARGATRALQAPSSRKDSKRVRPEDVIPFDDGDLGDF